MKQGQILILVLLIVVVILAVGLSVASRNITNLRTSTQTEHSQRAFTAAEGGVEDVLADLEQIGNVITGSSGTLPSNCTAGTGGDTAECTVDYGDIEAKVEVKSSNIYQAPIKLGDVAQIDMEGFGGSAVKVEWAIDNDPLEVQANGAASVEISLVYGSAPNYAVERWYFQGTSSPRVGESVGSGPADAQTSNCSPNGFEECVEIQLGAYTSPQVLRIRPFFTKTTARVAGVSADLSPQTYDISSSATSDIGVTRKVQVTRTALQQVPAVFDFALYSESDIEK